MKEPAGKNGTVADSEAYVMRSWTRIGPAVGLRCRSPACSRPAHLKDNFPGNTEDVVWMQALAKEADLVIVTADIRISRNPHEVLAWKQAGHTIFFLKPGWVNLPFWDQANKFTKCFPDLIKIAMRVERGSAFFVTVNGKIEPLK